MFFCIGFLVLKYTTLQPDFRVLLSWGFTLCQEEQECQVKPSVATWSQVWLTTAVNSQGYNLFIYQARQSLAWSQQGFWQHSFCRKCDLWRLCFDGRTKVKFSELPQWRKRKVELSSFFIISALWYIPFRHWIKALPNSSNQNKGFLNYVFCINWAVRNPAGTRLYSV